MTDVRKRGYDQNGHRPAIDSRCYDLAEHFLGDIRGSTENDYWELARTLQQACEDACQEIEERRESDA